MNFDVKTTRIFERKLKLLVKKYPSIGNDLEELEKQLIENPIVGTALGKNCYKIRMAISDKNKGKSGGARVITCVRILNNIVYLIDIYDKSDQENISDTELKMIINSLED